MNYDLKTTIDKENKYKKWVDKVVEYLERTAPVIGKSCSVMQSRAVLNKDIDVVFLGCNANEDYPYEKVDRDRFWNGNKFFYNNEKYHNNDAMFHSPWKVWYKPYNALACKLLNDTTPMEDGNYIFMNAIYFGTRTLNQMNKLPLIKEVKDTCLKYTDEVIHNIFCPKLIVCFSVRDCFDVLNRHFGFDDVIEVIPSHPIPNIHCPKKVKSATWKGRRVIGIPHPSQAISNDNWGAIGNFILQQYHEVCK